MEGRTALPQLDGGLFLTDGGLETYLIFLRDRELPQFAAFDLLKDDEGTEELRSYYEHYLDLAGSVEPGSCSRARHGARARTGRRRSATRPTSSTGMNRKAIGLMEELREAYRDRVSPIVISGCVGPHGDGYDPEVLLSADEAQEYHSTQIATFADTAADMVTAITMTYADEAIGIVRAPPRPRACPAAISFTVETDGRLPSGQPLGEAIEQIDAETGGGAGVLHDQLRPPDALRGRARGRLEGARAAACVPTRPR